jgi:hypothetical protein
MRLGKIVISVFLAVFLSSLVPAWGVPVGGGSSGAGSEGLPGADTTGEGASPPAPPPVTPKWPSPQPNPDPKAPFPGAGTCAATMALTGVPLGIAALACQSTRDGVYIAPGTPGCVRFQQKLGRSFEVAREICDPRSRRGPCMRLVGWTEDPGVECFDR